MTLRLVPVQFSDAALFVEAWHRHHRPPQGHKFSIGVADEENLLRGVVMVGRPVARHLDDGMTLEVTRTVTDDCLNYAIRNRITVGVWGGKTLKERQRLTRQRKDLL